MKRPDQASILHRRRIETAVLGRVSTDAVDSNIVQSWRRCLQRYSMDPAQRREPSIVDAVELRRRRAALGPAFDIVHAQILRLSQTLAASARVVFTDAHGVILDVSVDLGAAKSHRRSGIRIGAVWSEAEQGTNGMGTCLIEQRTVVIEPHLHFLAQNAELTCVATPIVDPRGLVLGALDISCYRMMEREPFVTLLNETARDIEDRLLQVESRQYFRVAFGHRRQYLGTVLEGILLADPQGCIVGANRAAVQLLGQSLRRDVCGRKIEDLLGLPLRKFGEARETDGAKRASVSSGARASFCVRMQPPRSAPEQRPDVQSSSVRAAVESAERDAVSAALQEWNWNISRTARALGIGRKTLYRKIQRHQLQ